MVVDSYYYDVLKVPTDTDDAAIRKSYYRLAVLYHPDKNTAASPAEKAELEAKFKEINDAYQILSDKSKRSLYDRQGRSEFQDSSILLDPKEVFRQIFGGGEFDDFIGELSFAQIFEEESLDARLTSSPKKSFSFDSAKMHELSCKRQVRVAYLAAKLIDRLTPYVDGTQGKDLFLKNSHELAVRLSHESFGAELLKSIGFIYSIKAKQYFGKKSFLGLSSIYHSVKEKGHLFGQIYNTISAAHRLSNSGANSVGGANQNTIDSESAKDLLWQMACTDIEIVLSEVCDIVLSTKLSPERYAEGLKLMGDAFRKFDL